MNINSAKLIYFSPTGTTRKVLESIAQGARISPVEHIDLTPPAAKTLKLADMDNELAIIGVPVYGGRLPADAFYRLRNLRGHGAAAVIVVVYGNRAYEDALLELNDLCQVTGFIPVAAGAFIGEHSYSGESTPIAPGRPDVEDLRKAKEFGKTVCDKIKGMRELQEMPALRVPGNYPYKELKTLSNISPVTQEVECRKCELCASVCPVAAISVKDTVTTDSGVCLRCCACVKNCPAGARVMEDPRIRQIADQLKMNCSARKEPETYV